MMQGITDPSADDRMDAAVERVEAQVAQLTEFDIHRANMGKLLVAGLEVLDSPPLTDAQRNIETEYQWSLPPKERECLRLHKLGRSSEAIARELQLKVEWVRRTNARHLMELRVRLYP